MKRTKTEKKVTAILCSDIHLREDQPICRTDNFIETQAKKLIFLSDLQKKYDCPVLHGGDLFHHWKPSPALLSYTIELLPNHFYSVCGQHDLPQHNFELYYKSGINVLDKVPWYIFILSSNTDNFSIDKQGDISLYGCSWGQSPDKNRKYSKKNILIWHTMVYHKENPYLSDNASPAIQLLKKYPQFDLILTGDNHIPFVTEYQGRLLVNPGSFTRQRSSEIHEPRIYLYFAEDNTVEKVILPHSKDIITREHLEAIEQRDNRIDAFISRLNNNEINTTLDFEENMKIFLAQNPIRKSVEELIYKAIE